MFFVVNKSAFLKELSLVQGVVERKNTIPILSHLLLETSESEVSIKVTDLDISFTTQCKAEITNPGAVCVQAKKLFEIIKALPEAEVEIKSVDSDQVMVTSERSKFRLVGLTRDNFPEIKQFNGLFVPLPSSLLKTFIDRTSFAITNEESRYALNGAKLELTNDFIRMVTTDGHRLSFIEKTGNFSTGENVDVLIPRKTLMELAKLCAEANEVIEFGKDENHLYFKADKRFLSSRLLSGQFPNYELVLPKDKRIPVTFEAQHLSNAVRRVALIADEKSHSVKFELSVSQLRISSQSAALGESEDTLTVDYDGPQITVGFNAQYLLDFFSIIQGGHIALNLKDGNSQVELTPTGETEFLFRYIVMPMRL